MKIIHFFTFSLSISLLLSTTALSQDRKPPDLSWIPDELSSTLKSQPIELLAKRTPSSGAKYYIVDILKEGAAYVNFYKVENGKAEHLGESMAAYPFSKFIKDPEAVEKLWDDYLARWIKSEGKDAIQKRFNQLTPQDFTAEEKYFLKKAGFSLPEPPSAKN